MHFAIVQSHTVSEIILYLGAFAIVAVAAGRMAGAFQRIKLPLISGFLVIGLLSGPEILGLIEPETLEGLRFLNDIALAFIAFAVGTELYLNELRSRMKSIMAMVFTQMVVTFLLVSLTMYFLAGLIPFLNAMSLAARLSVALLAGTVAIARSPASAIAIINELRARGPFTQTALGVTVVKDFGVIVFFAIIFTLSKSLIQEVEFKLIYIAQVMAELIVAGGLGFVVWQLLRLILEVKGAMGLKKVLVLVLGFMVYFLSHFIKAYSLENLGVEMHIEPLLICIIGSFLVTNYTAYRNDFVRLVKELGPYVYIVFFTLTGAMISVNVLASL